MRLNFVPPCQVGDYVDTLLLPSSGMKRATVRWIPGPVEITGTGSALLHCHLFPHSDEGCILKTQILDKRCARTPCPSSKSCLLQRQHGKQVALGMHA